MIVKLITNYIRWVWGCEPLQPIGSDCASGFIILLFAATIDVMAGVVIVTCLFTWLNNGEKKWWEK